MLRQAEAVGNRRARHSHFGASPELRIILHQLFVMGSFPMDIVFMFDGPNRPEIKRGKKVSPLPHWLTEQTHDLVSAFGYVAQTVRFSILFVHECCEFMKKGSGTRGSRG